MGAAPNAASSGPSYAATLAAGLQAGLAEIDPAVRETHLQSVLRFQQTDGGFSGRQGPSDLYYTAFAARVLHALQAVDSQREALSAYAAAQQPRGIVDVLNWANLHFVLGRPIDQPEMLMDEIERHRARDGGYAMRPDGTGSTYHTFLAVVCYDLLRRPLPDAASAAALLRARRQPDGGYSEHAAVRRSSTNATAAGAVAAQRLNVLDDATRKATVDWLLSQQDPGGGWKATRATPMPDLMSAATSLICMLELGTLDRPTLQRAWNFATRCTGSGGGFGAGPDDPGVDTEYTFYGLALQALRRLAAM
jgi:geranylgeranyl transferase type-2 subunit beta